jgi:hypothetical protein
MHDIGAMQTQVETAEELAGLLEAAWDGFGMIVAGCRECEERSGGLFAAFAYASAAAAQGRVVLAAAPSLDAHPGGDAGCDRSVSADLKDLEGTADSLAGLAGLLAARLAEAARQAGDPADRDICAQAGAAAARACRLLARDEP